MRPYNWRDSIGEFALKLRWAGLGAIVLAAGIPLALGNWNSMVFLGLLLGLWLAMTTLAGLLQRVGGAGAAGLLGRLRAQPQSYYGMLLAHLGVAVFVLGVTMTKGYEIETDVKMNVGDTTELGDYTFKLAALRKLTGPNYEGVRATVEVLRESRSLTTIHPEKRLYVVQNMPMTEAGLDMGVLRHPYVSLGNPVGDGA